MKAIQTLRVILLLLLPLALSPSAFAADVNIKRIHKANWLSAESEHFQLITNLKTPKAKQMAVELEEFYFFVTQLLDFHQKEYIEKITIIATKNKKDFGALGFEKNIAGMFVHGHEEYALFANAAQFRSSSTGRKSPGRQIVLHEITHLIVRNSQFDFAVPYWYSEGIAEYLGTYVKKRNQIFLGNFTNINNRFYSLLNRAGTNYQNFDIEELLKATKRSEMTTREKDAFYARAFTFVHYLNTNPARHQRLYEFLHVLEGGVSIDAAYQQTFNMSYAETNKTLNEYIKRRDHLARVFDIGKGQVEFPKFEVAINKMEKRDALETVLSKILIRHNGYADLTNPNGKFDAALKIYPDFFGATDDSN